MLVKVLFSPSWRLLWRAATRSRKPIVRGEPECPPPTVMSMRCDAVGGSHRSAMFVVEASCGQTVFVYAVVVDHPFQGTTLII
jgi:hypothetical protein